MKTKLLQLACLITGYEYNVVRGYDSWSRRKVSIFAVVILLPTSVAFINGFLLTNKILEADLAKSVLVAFICSTLIFFIERVVVMSKGGWPIGLIRLVLACVIAIVGSFALKEVIFEKDINKELANRRLSRSSDIKEMIRRLHAGEIQQLESLITTTQQQYDDLMERAKNELVSPLRPGHGPIASTYLFKAGEARSTLLPLLAKRDSVNAAIDAAVQTKQTQDASTDGLWTRIDVFMDMTMKNGKNQIMFWILFLLFSIDMFVWVMKIGLAPSVLDEEENISMQLVR